mgnify:CR=1 FL=1
MDAGADSRAMADWVDRHTWMICLHCGSGSAKLERRADGRYCRRCGRMILRLCNPDESNTWMRCPHGSCQGEEVKLERWGDGLYCPKCRRRLVKV